MLDPVINALVSALRPLMSRCNTATYWQLFPGSTMPVRRTDGTPLRASDVRGHLLGGRSPRIGLAHILPGTSTTRVAVLDFDSHPKGNRKGVSWGDMVAAAQGVQDALWRRGMHVTPFRSSGGAGIHLYLLWDDPQDAYSVRRLLFDALTDCGLQSGAKGLAYGQVEVFPKQDDVGVGEWGNMVYLPLAAKSVPLELIDLDVLDRDAALSLDWRLSPPVPIRERPAPDPALIVRPLAEIVGEDMALEQVAAALAAIPNGGGEPGTHDTELDYDAWFSAMAGTHNATGGSDAGLELFHQFSSRSTKYNPDLTAYKWNSLSMERAGGARIATADTLFLMARPFGFMLDIAADFEPLEPIKNSDGSIAEDLPALQRDKKGRAEATLPNVRSALSDPRLCGACIRFDTFTQALMISGAGGQSPRPFRDEDYTDLQIHMERGGAAKFKPIGERTLVRAVAREGLAQQFDSAQQWLQKLQWDGVPRVNSFFVRYFRTEDVAYTTALSRYLWTALAGRVLDPGCQADMAPVLVGGEGLGKSRGIRDMVPDGRFHCEIDLHDNEAETGRRLRGKLIGEIAEMRGLDTKDREAILKMMSRSVDEWTPKYVEHARASPRRAVFIGTSNNEFFLKGEQGERRWLPVVVGEVDRTALVADRLQLWAEAVVMWRAEGLLWEPVYQLAGAYRANFCREDAIAGEIDRWLHAEGDFGEQRPCDREFISMRDVATAVYGRRVAELQGYQQVALTNALRKLGYRTHVNDRPKVEGERLRVWRKIPAQ